jgi:hypothetical protein
MEKHAPLTDRTGCPYTPAEVLAILHLKDYATLARWRAIGSGPPFIRLGKKHARLLYPRAPFWKWLDEKTFKDEDQAEAAGCR